MAEVALGTAGFPGLPKHGILHRPAGAGTFGRPGDIVPACRQAGGKGIAVDLLSGLRGPGGPDPVHLHRSGPVPDRQDIATVSRMSAIWRRVKRRPRKVVDLRASIRGSVAVRSRKDGLMRPCRPHGSENGVGGKGAWNQSAVMPCNTASRS